MEAVRKLPVKMQAKSLDIDRVYDIIQAIMAKLQGFLTPIQEIKQLNVDLVSYLNARISITQLTWLGNMKTSYLEFWKSNSEGSDFAATFWSDYCKLCDLYNI